MNSLDICSLNANGIRNRKKRQSLFRTLKSKKYDIVCLQETFITNEVKDVWEKEWGGDLIFFPGTSNSLGQVILFKHQFPFKVNIELLSERTITISLYCLSC